MKERIESSKAAASNDDMEALPDSLPFEVIVEILALASRLSASTALSICLVATWTKALGLEGLYGVALLSNVTSLEMFFNTLGYAPKTDSLSLRIHDLRVEMQAKRRQLDILRGMSRRTNRRFTSKDFAPFAVRSEWCLFRSVTTTHVML